MSVHNTAYNTTACANFRMEKVVEAVREAQVRDYLSNQDGVVYIYNGSGAQGAVPAFKHALFVSKRNSSDIRHSPDARLEPFLAMDIRTAGRIDRENGTFKITNSTLYKNLLYRGALTAIWLSNGPNAFRSVTPLAMSIFASWISEAVGFRFHLDAKARLDIMTLAGIFYQSNHLEGVEFDKANENRHIASIANALKLNVTDVMKMYNITKAITSMEDFCNKVKMVLSDVRLENFNAGLLVLIMQGTWTNEGNELVAVALEHPPTWLAVLYEAYTNLALKKIGLAKICCERRQYQGGDEKIELVFKANAPDTDRMLRDPHFNAVV